MTNFLSSHKGRSHRRWWSPRATRWTIGIVVGIVVLGGVGFLLYRQPAYALYRAAIDGKHNFEGAKVALTGRDYGTARSKLQIAVQDFTDAQASAKRLRSLEFLPVVGTQIKALDGLLQVGINGGNAAVTLTNVAEHVTAPLNKGDVSFANISSKEKADVLKLVSQTEPDLQGAKADIDLAVEALNHIPKKGLLGPVASAVEPLREQLPSLQNGLAQSMPLVRVMPGILGYPTPRSYLFLLQNNTELRPTGGFIGTYGAVNFSNGEITTFTTHNVYELDTPAEKTITTVPPDPLKKYLKADKWFFRDSNWSPDFPTSAKQGLQFYDAESNGSHNYDGVIAITPTFIASLMKVTGNITTGGTTYTPDNLVDKLEYQVEILANQQGVSDADRKQVIGDLAQQLFERILATPQSKWGDLWKVLEENVANKQVLMYLTRDKEETFVADLGWGGQVRSTDGDYVFVNDANLASLKSDPGVKRDYTYTVEEKDNALQATLKVHYDNQGTFNWKSTRYRTYVRIYVPQGSVLRSSAGYLTNDKLQNGKPTEATASDELGKTVFSGFTSIEPKEQGTLELHYSLPDSLYQAWKDGTYSLLAQKQAGTDNYGLSLDIAGPGRLQSYSPADGATVDGQHIRYQTSLSKDQLFSLHYHR